MRLQCGNYRTVGMPNVGANIGGGGVPRIMAYKGRLRPKEVPF